MIIKSPSKRVSQLDLKFLDLRFMSIDQPYVSRTDPLPRLNESSIDPTKISGCNMDSKYQSIQEISQCEKGSFLKMNKKSMFKADENTRDVTNQNCMESILGQNLELDTERVLNYLSADTETIFKQFGSKGPICNKSQKKKQDTQNINSQLYRQDSIDKQMRKYEEQVKNFQKENELIHNQITRIYSDKIKDKNLQVKNVRNMRIFEENQRNNLQDKNGIQHYYAQVTESYRYESQDKQVNKLKKGFFDKFKSTAQIYDTELKNGGSQQNEPKQKKQHKHALSECKSLRSNSSNYQLLNKKISPHKLSKQHKLNDLGIKFPNLIQHKYDKFYQELYKGRRDKVILTEKQKQLINQDGKSIETLEELKKRMINNNFDKNFEAFLQQKKIRVPQFIKNLR